VQLLRTSGRVTRSGRTTAVAAIALLTALTLVGCSDGEAVETLPPTPSTSDGLSASAAGTGLSRSQQLAYDQAVEAVQRAYRVADRLYHRGKLDVHTERQLREVMIGKALHLSRGGLGVFENRQWHTQGVITVEPLEPEQVKPREPAKDDGLVVFVGCADRSQLWIVGANGKRLEQEGAPRGVVRYTAVEHGGTWKYSESKVLEKRGTC
jgi:hypothetical protein